MTDPPNNQNDVPRYTAQYRAIMEKMETLLTAKRRASDASSEGSVKDLEENSMDVIPEDLSNKIEKWAEQYVESTGEGRRALLQPTSQEKNDHQRTDSNISNVSSVVVVVSSANEQQAGVDSETSSLSSTITTTSTTGNITNPSSNESNHKTGNMLGRLFRRTNKTHSGNHSASSSGGSASSFDAHNSSNRSGNFGSQITEQRDATVVPSFQFLKSDPFLTNLQLLLEKLESYAHAKKIASKFLSRKYLNDVHNVLISLECHAKDTISKESNISPSANTVKSCDSSTPRPSSHPEGDSVESNTEPGSTLTDTEDISSSKMPTSHFVQYRDLLPPEARTVWDTVIEQQKQQYLQSQQVNKSERKRHTILQSIENQTRLSFSEFLDVFMKFVKKNHEDLARHMNPFIHVQVVKQFELKKFHYILFKFFIQTHSLAHVTPSEQMIETISQRSGATTGGGGKHNNSQTKRKPTSSSCSKTDNASKEQQKSPLEDCSYLQNVVNEHICFDIDHNLLQFESIHVHELYMFTRHRDLLENFAAIVLDQEKELTNTKRLIAATCCNLARSALDMCYMHKFKYFNNMKQYYDKINSKLTQDSKESKEIIGDAKRFAEFRRKITMESAFKEANDWRSELHRRHYEAQLRDLMSEEFEKHGFRQFPAFTFDTALATQLASKTEPIVEEFSCSYYSASDEEDAVNNIHLSTSFYFETGALILTTKHIYFVSHASVPPYSSMSTREINHLISSNKRVMMKDSLGRTLIKVPLTQALDTRYGLASRFAPSTLTIVLRDGQVIQFSNLVTSEHCHRIINTLLEKILFSIKQHGETEVIKQGYLVKQGKNVKNWKKRWFLLYADRFIYRKSERSNKDLGQIMARNILGVEREPNSSRSKYLNCFSVLTVGRRYRIQCANPHETSQWVTAFQTTLRRQNLEFPYVYFGLFKRNIRSKFQWRILQFDFLTKTIKNLSGDKVKRQFQFSQVEHVRALTNWNPLHIQLTFRNHPHKYELYLQTPRQAMVMHALARELQDKKQFCTIKEALEMERSLYVKSGFAFELVDSHSKTSYSTSSESKSGSTNDSNTIIPEVLTDSHGKMRITMRHKHKPDKVEDISNEQILLQKTTIKRWLILQAGELIAFNGSCDGYPLYALSLHEAKVTHRKNVLVPAKKKKMFKKAKHEERMDPDTDMMETRGEILVISFGDVEKTFEFASREECLEWEKVLLREYEHEMHVFESVEQNGADDDDSQYEEEEDEQGDAVGETAGDGVKILNWFEGAGSNRPSDADSVTTHDGDVNRESPRTVLSDTSSSSTSIPRIGSYSPAASALVSNVGFHTPRGGQTENDDSTMVNIRKRSRMKSLRLAKTSNNLRTNDDGMIEEKPRRGNGGRGSSVSNKPNSVVLRQSLTRMDNVNPNEGQRRRRKSSETISEQSDFWENELNSETVTSQIDDVEYDDEEQDSEEEEE